MSNLIVICHRSANCVHHWEFEMGVFYFIKPCTCRVLGFGELMEIRKLC